MTEQNQQPEMQQTPPKKQRRVGTVAFGLTLVAAGVLLVAKTFVPALDLITIARFAPAILVVLGVEVLVYAARPDVVLKYDFLSMFATAFILLLIGGASLVPLAVQYLSPEWDGTISRMRSQLEQKVYAAVSADASLQNAVHDASVNVYGDKYLNAEGRMVWDEESAYEYVYFTFNPLYQTAEEFAADCQAVMAACKKAGLNIREYQFDTWNGNAGEEVRPYFTLNVNGPWLSDADVQTLANNVSTQWYYRDGVFSSREALEEYMTTATAETAMEESTLSFDGQEMTEEELYTYMEERASEAYENGYTEGYTAGSQNAE